MISAEVIQKMKQTNISKDAEKTKQRVKELWKNASEEEKLTIEGLAGVKRTTIARAYKTGNISAKLVVPIAQTLNADPTYLTGEADKKGTCTDKAMNNFLNSVKSNKAKAKTVTEAEHAKAPKPAKAAAPAKPDVSDNDVFDALSDDEVMQLVRSLLIKSRAGGKHADTLKNLKALLFS